jgi:hypothetical protein
MLFFMLLLGSANATEYWEACNGCSDTQERQAAVRSVPVNTPGIFDVYVMDFQQVTVQKYRVSVFFARRDGGYQSAAIKTSTEAHIAYEFEQTVHAIKGDFLSVEDDIPIPPGVAPSVYDVIHNTSLQKRLSDYINENMSIWQSIAAPVAVPLRVLGKIVDLNFGISVTFADGSTARFLLTGLDGTLFSLVYTFEFEKGTARDADGNLVPSTAEEAAPYSGVFSTTANAEALIDFINEWYSGEMAPLVCSAESTSGGVTVTCKKR